MQTYVGTGKRQHYSTEKLRKIAKSQEKKKKKKKKNQPTFRGDTGGTPLLQGQKVNTG